MEDEGQKVLQEAIVRTVSWFSLFSYPICAEDIWKWLIVSNRTYSLADVRQVLAWPKWYEGVLQEEDGWYALAQHKPIADMQRGRKDRILDAARKFSKLRRVVKWFGLLPSVRAVGAVNTLAWWHTKPQSDIDLFLIVRPGTLWITRLLLVLPFALLGKRPVKNGGEEPVDPFCFSFFVTTDVEDVARLQIEGGDLYLAFWVRAIVPLFDRDGYFTQFQNKNAWVKQWLPNAPTVLMHKQMGVKPLPCVPFPWFRFDAFAEKIQRKRFPDRIKDLANKDTRVVISGQMLKFYVNDRRQEYRDRWIEICKQL
jgi:hypothetical protein